MLSKFLIFGYLDYGGNYRNCIFELQQRWSKRGIKLLGSMNAECIEFNVAAAWERWISRKLLEVELQAGAPLPCPKNALRHSCPLAIISELCHSQCCLLLCRLLLHSLGSIATTCTLASCTPSSWFMAKKLSIANPHAAASPRFGF